MSIMDILDDFVFGPFNLISRIEGLFKEVKYDDSSVRFALVRLDKGGSHNFHEVRTLLNKYGISIFGVTHDSQCLFFRVKQRQAAWSEYLLLHAGVELRIERLIDPRNAKYVAMHTPGWMPTPWIERKNQPDAETEGERVEHSPLENDNKQNNREFSSVLRRLVEWFN